LPRSAFPGSIADALRAGVTMQDDSLPFPQVSGALDLDYLHAALTRAGLPPPRGEPRTEALLDGRTGGIVLRVSVDDRRFVLKYVQDRSWRVTALGLARGGEHRLWAHGVTRALAGPIECPVLDVAHEPAADRYWVLMRDVSEGIRARGQFSREDSRTLVAGLAAMQAPHYDAAELARAPLPVVTGPTEAFRRAVLQLSGKRTSDEPWLAQLITDFEVVRAFLPLFLEQLGPQLADELLALADDDAWVEALGREPQTLLHGDLRRANISFGPERISLFDWEFAARGPAGADLQWHCLLHYWGYPPDGAIAGDDCDDLAELYVSELAARLGRAVDRNAFERGWQLGWIKAVVQVGYVLVDPLHPTGADADTRQRIAVLCRRAVQRALDMRAAL
jgi:hypothetical protein